MDYAIYKTTDGKNPRVIHRFTQEACNHQAKKKAKAKLHQMWKRVCERTYSNTKLEDNGFSYDFMTSSTTSEQIRFYIAKL